MKRIILTFWFFLLTVSFVNAKKCKPKFTHVDDFTEITTELWRGKLTSMSVYSLNVKYIPSLFDIKVYVFGNNPTSIVVCDDVGKYTEFDLILKEQKFSGGILEIESDVQSAINTLISPYINQNNPQTIFLRIDDTMISYLRIMTLELHVILYDEDSDADGVPNSDEDINQNGDLYDDDTDDDGVPNFLDEDDDDDKVLTIDETTGSGSGRGVTYVYIDTDDDTIENYLDTDDDNDGILTENEDYNQNGDPLDDDTNSNGIPDFLDDTVSLGSNDYIQDVFTFYPNPVNDLLTIAFKESQSLVTIVIYNIQGQKVYDRILDIQSNSTQLNVSNYKAGIYFVKVSSRTKTNTQKIIIE